ncbi:MAG: DUF4386 domain-containing protein [Acidobacteriales bacterium]|nr:DUF4386 domain-containing protein [Terriglobales bacterium]
MSTLTVTKRIREASPRLKARIAGALYLLTFVTADPTLTKANAVNNLIAAVCYIAVTVLFYYIFRPVNRSLSLLAALVSLVGCVYSGLSLFNVAPLNIHPLVFFGFYCPLIGYLILRSTFLPRILGALMVLAGVGWLTFMSPSLAKYLFPYNLAPGIIGEGALTLWLVVMGVNEERWTEQARLEPQ